MRKINLLIVVIILGIGICSCGKKSDQANEAGLSGKYPLVSWDMDGHNLLEMGLGDESADYFVEFEGKDKASFFMPGFKQILDFTYKVDGNKLVVKYALPEIEEEMEGEWSFDGNKVFLSAEGNPETEGYSSIKLIFEKK